MAEVLPFVVVAGGGASLELCEEIAAAGYRIVVTEGGAPVFGMVMEPCGRELVITAAGGRSRHYDLTRAGFAMADVQGQGFKSIRFETKRLGLVRRAARLGYAVIDRKNNVYIMRKATQ